MKTDVDIGSWFATPIITVKLPQRDDIVHSPNFFAAKRNRATSIETQIKSAPRLMICLKAPLICLVGRIRPYNGWLVSAITCCAI